MEIQTINNMLISSMGRLTRTQYSDNKGVDEPSRKSTPSDEKQIDIKTAFICTPHEGAYSKHVVGIALHNLNTNIVKYVFTQEGLKDEKVRRFKNSLPTMSTDKNFFEKLKKTSEKASNRDEVTIVRIEEGHTYRDRIVGTLERLERDFLGSVLTVDDQEAGPVVQQATSEEIRKHQAETSLEEYAADILTKAIDDLEDQVEGTKVAADVLYEDVRPAHNRAYGVTVNGIVNGGWYTVRNFNDGDTFDEMNFQLKSKPYEDSTGEIRIDILEIDEGNEYTVFAADYGLCADSEGDWHPHRHVIAYE